MTDQAKTMATLIADECHALTESLGITGSDAIGAYMEMTVRLTKLCEEAARRAAEAYGRVDLTVEHEDAVREAVAAVMGEVER